MEYNTLDSKMIRNMVIAGAKFLETKKEYVNELNVFPVPDGDTGSNMTLTILSAAREVENANINEMNDIAKAMSSGSLRGARGNSGVILSQLVRGFAQGISDNKEVDTMILAKAFERATKTAYKAVMKPREGTILTVARAVSEKAAELAFEKDDILEMIREVLNYAKEVLRDTPNMLPVLKEAGVVDAGGQGLLYILEGAYHYLESGNNDLLNMDDFDTSSIISGSATFMDSMVLARDKIEFGYCTEFIVHTKAGADNELDSKKLRKYLEGIGDSIVAVSDDEYIKIHVHTNDPGLAIQEALKYGFLSGLKIENMRIQYSERVKNHLEETKDDNETKPMGEAKEVGFIAVSSGEGFEEILKGLGVDYIVKGGQTMNPSTEDFVEAAQKINAKTIFIFPNNSNIILAAEQAEYLVKDKEIIVIPSKNLPQGISALISYNEKADVEDNKEEMLEIISEIRTGEITYAVRDTKIGNKEIKQNDIIALNSKDIIAAEKTVEEATKKLLEDMVDEDTEILTIFYGESTKEEDAKKIKAYAEEVYEDCDVELYYGGQPLYYYIISVE